MANDARIEVRVPSELLARLERVAARLSRETGIEIKPAAVARKILGEGLDALDKPTRKKGA